MEFVSPIYFVTSRKNSKDLSTNLVISPTRIINKWNIFIFTSSYTLRADLTMFVYGPNIKYVS